MEKMLVKLYNESNEAAEFLCHSILGRGQFSTAYLATRLSDGLDVILKKLAPRHPSATDSVRFRDAYNLQVELLNKTDNTAAPVIGFYKDENDVPWIALQKMTGDTLGKTIFQNLQDLFHVFCGVTKGLGQFHSAGYLMLDLSPNNLFVLSNGGSMEGCYFFDFDAFVSKENLTDLKWIHSTRGFLAPEIKAFQKTTELNEGADIYALGASLYYCLTGAVPDSYTYFDYNEADIREQYKIDCTQKIKEKLKAFFYQTLNPLPAERFADWNAVYIALKELSDLADPKNRVRLHSNIILDVGEYYIPTPTQLQQLSNFFLPKLGQKAYAVIYGNVSGCGKTTLAKAFAKTAGKHYDSIQFCNYDPKSSWDGILSQVNAVNCPMDAKDHNEQVLNALQSGHQRTLIIIDNFDQETCHEQITDWGEETHILFTSSYMAGGLKALNPCERVDMDCSQELSRKIFTTVYSGLSGKTLTEKQKEIAINLLEQVGYHTYSADLIARELAQHYPTEEGFANFADNTHRLWQSKISSRKDLNIGQATSHKTYQTHIELLFADLLSQFTDPVEMEILCLFSFDRIWDKELFFSLVGDNLEDGRFRGKDAVARMRERNYITETDKEISVHPLVYQLLAEQYADEEKQESFFLCFLSNFYTNYRNMDRLNIKLFLSLQKGFFEKIDGFIQKWYQSFQYLHILNGPQDFCLAEGLALVHLSYWRVEDIAWLRRSQYDRIPHRKSIRTYMSRKKTEAPNLILCSAMDNTRRLYAFYLPESNETFPLIAVSTSYLDENYNVVIGSKDIIDCKGAVSIERAIWNTKNMVLPALFCGKPIRDVYDVTWSIFSEYRWKDGCTVQIPLGVETIHKYAFVSTNKLEKAILPRTIKSIGPMAFAFCRFLKKISLPSDLEHLGDCAFQWCAALTEVTIPDDIKLKKIGTLTFEGCESLSTITIPYNVQEIGSLAFSGCTELKAVTIINKNLQVADDSFCGCSKLRTILAPKEWKAANRELLKSLPAYEPDENDPPEE